WTAPPWTWQQSQSSLVSGTVYVTAIYLRAGVQLTGLVVYVNPGGTTLTLTRVGIYQGQASSASLLAQSADQPTSFQTAAQQIIPSTAAYPPSVDGVYYAAVIQVGTPPGTLLGGLPGAIMPQVTGKLAFGMLLAGQTDLPATATFAASAKGVGFAAY